MPYLNIDAISLASARSVLSRCSLFLAPARRPTLHVAFLILSSSSSLVRVSLRHRILDHGLIEKIDESNLHKHGRHQPTSVRKDSLLACISSFRSRPIATSLVRDTPSVDDGQPHSGISCPPLRHSPPLRDPYLRAFQMESIRCTFLICRVFLRAFDRSNSLSLLFLFVHISQIQ